MNRILWAIFGNDDDGLVQPGLPDTVLNRIKWWVRNPFHNFTFYVIGCEL